MKVLSRGSLADLATAIAEDLFKCGTVGSDRCQRIEFKGGEYTRDYSKETSNGGLCRDAMIEFLMNSLAKHTVDAPIALSCDEHDSPESTCPVFVIRPLHWRWNCMNGCCQSWWAPLPFGHYTVSRYRNSATERWGQYVVSRTMNGANEQTVAIHVDTLGAAKLAAWQDWQDRLSPALKQQTAARNTGVKPR